MGYKRKKSEGELEPEIENDHRKKPMMQKEEKEILPSTIKNKEKRSEVHAKLKHQKKLEKRKKAKARDAAEKRALELGEEVYNLFVFTHFLTAIADFLIKLFFFFVDYCSRRRRWFLVPLRTPENLMRPCVSPTMKR